MLKWCVANRVGYRVVDPADLDKLAATADRLRRQLAEDVVAWTQEGVA